MDISIINPASPAPARSSAPASSGDGTTFARQLQQAVDQRGRPAGEGNDSSATPSAAAPGASQPTTANAQAAAPAAGELPDSPSVTAPEVLPVEAEVQPTQDLVQLLAGQTDTVSPDASVDTPLGRLEEIRRRLALIEQAGELPRDNPLAALNGAQPVPAAQVLTQAFAATSTTSETIAPSTHGVSPLLGQNGTQHPREVAVDTSAKLETSTPAPTDTAPEAGPSLADAPLESQVRSAIEGSRSEPLPAALLAATSASTTPSGASGSVIASASLSAPLASREWQIDLGQQLIGLHQRGGQQVELHLHPTELGPLSVSLKLNELGAHAQFLSAHPQVRAAVEQAIPQLREALASQGITLGETSVGEHHQPAAEQQAQQQPQGRRSSGQEVTSELSITSDSRDTLRPLLGQVDLYA